MLFMIFLIEFDVFSFFCIVSFFFCLFIIYFASLNGMYYYCYQTNISKVLCEAC